MKTQKETQRQKVLRLLKEAGQSGINSHDLTYIHGIKQAPTRVQELEAEGYNILATPPLENRSVNYILNYIPPELKTRKFIGFEGNRALYVYE